MAKYGTLEFREKTNSDGSIIEALLGPLAVPGLMTGSIAIAHKSKTVGNEWPLEVKVYQDGVWASLGSAKFERKNPKASWYIRVVIDSPVLQMKLGAPLWLRAFPDKEQVSEKPKFAESYEVVWSGSGGTKKPSADNSIADDEIPF